MWEGSLRPIILSLLLKQSSKLSLDIDTGHPDTTQFAGTSPVISKQRRSSHGKIAPTTQSWPNTKQTATGAYKAKMKTATRQASDSPPKKSHSPKH